MSAIHFLNFLFLFSVDLEQPEEVPDVDKEFDADELMVSKTCFICVKCEFHSLNENTTRDHIYAKHSLDHKTAPTTNEQIVSMPNSENININDQLASGNNSQSGNDVQNLSAIGNEPPPENSNVTNNTATEEERPINEETVKNSIEIPKDSITSIESAQSKVSSENGLKKSSPDVSSKAKRYKCSKCPEIFFKFDEVGIHFRNSHPEKIPVITKVNAEKTLLCNRCDKKFSQMNALREHKLTHTKKNSNAPNSNKSIENTNLKTFSCRICKTNFYQLTDWKNHSEEHKKKSFQCEICSKTFTRKATLNGHKKIHQITNQITKKVPNQKAQKASSVSLKRKPDANSKMFPEVPKKKQKTSPNVPSTTV